MKKTLSIILVAIMLCSMLTVFASAETKAPDYDAAKNGDILYNVDFSGTDGIYAPTSFRQGSASMAATTVTTQDDGKTLVATTPNAVGAWFYGSAIKGLTLGNDKQYTISFTAKFPANNAGMYFNFADVSGETDPTKNTTYNYLYGFYGKIAENPTICMTMSYGAGGKFTAEKISKFDAYTAVPAGISVDNDGFVNVEIKIDGLFYSVWFNGILYDQAFYSDSALKVAPYLGFSVYLYNKNQELTVKNVVVKKGCDYLKSNSIRNTGDASYSDYTLGEKITTLDWTGNSEIFKPYFVQNKTPDSITVSTAIDGSGVVFTTNSTTGNAHWYGSEIGNLKITDDTKYTFIYKEKDTASYSGSAAFNGVKGALNAANRYNWYGTFTGAANPLVKLGYNGSNFTGYGYTDANMTCFNAIKPTVDSDGYTEIVTELNGWTWTIYMHDENQGGKLVAVQTADFKALGTEQNHPIMHGDNLAFVVYTYNANISFAVKDVEVYKGLMISETYQVPTTGDNAVWVVAIAMVSLFGMGIAFKAVKH